MQNIMIDLNYFNVGSRPKLLIFAILGLKSLQCSADFDQLENRHNVNGCQQLRTFPRGKTAATTHQSP